MPVTGKLFGQAIAKAFNKEIDWVDDTIKGMLCTSSYTPNQDTHDYKDDVTNEVVGTGYVAGGKALTTKSISYDAGTNTIKFLADDLAWTASTITARYLVIYADTGVAGTSALIGYIDFGQDFISTEGTLTIDWGTDGIFTSAAA
jgi:hypothetical protein